MYVCIIGIIEDLLPHFRARRIKTIHVDDELCVRYKSRIGTAPEDDEQFAIFANGCTGDMPIMERGNKCHCCRGLLHNFHRDYLLTPGSQIDEVDQRVNAMLEIDTCCPSDEAFPVVGQKMKEATAAIAEEELIEARAEEDRMMETGVLTTEEEEGATD